ncbi:M23 family metallopeptidase [Thalassotalea aquiviva]|uniref:M23 family metallopeptidase n=1 Tax=Thalassotalea aquiviva TaxID=3242415 RepID=UPI00352B06AE
MRKNKVYTFWGLCLACCLNWANAEVLLELEGALTQGGLMVGKTEAANKVLFDDRALKVSKHGYFTFGFSRDDDKTHTLTITEPSGETLSKALTPTKRQYNIQKIEGIAKKIMQPDPKALERIRQDNKKIGQVRAVSSSNIDFAHGFKAPANGVITGVYGSQRYYNGVPKNPHFGLDYAGKKGTPVYAPAAGTVTLWVPDMFYSGGTLVIDHGHGITSTFLHLSGADVKVGDRVLQSQPVARIGSTGRSTGPHLDWRINWYNVKLDPALALELPNFRTFSAPSAISAQDE